MKNESHLFKEVRKGVSNTRQIVVVEYCTADFLTDKNIEAVIIKNDMEEKLPCSYKILHNFDIGYSSDKIFSKILIISIQIPIKISEGDWIGIYTRNHENNRLELYKSKGNEIIKILKSINFSLDMVKEESEEIVVRGWVIDFEHVRLTIKNSRSGEIQPLSGIMLERQERPDVMRWFAECDRERNIGFLIRIPSQRVNDNLQLVIQAGQCERVEKIKITRMHSLCEKVIECIKGVWIKGKNLLFGLTKKVSSFTKIHEHRMEKFSYTPQFSVLVSVFESNKKFLRQLIESMQAQSYDNWELCLANGDKDSICLQEIILKYGKKDRRIKYIGLENEVLGEAGIANCAYRIATGEYIVVCNQNDFFSANALYACVKALNEKHSHIIYTDEDKTDIYGRRFFSPNYKPNFNLDLLRCNNYINHMFVVERKLFDQVGGFDESCKGAWWYDFVFRCVEQTREICHIPTVLYHHRENTTLKSEDLEVYEKQVIESHLKRMGENGVVEIGEEQGLYNISYPINGTPLISIIIPNMDHIQDLNKCMNSIDQQSTYRNYEFVIIENNSKNQETFTRYKELEKRRNVRVLYWAEEFNYSLINNYGVKHAKGSYILFLNNDTEMINADCIEQMLGYCQRSEVGIVGAKLYYDDNTIQHAGVIVGLGGIAGHAFAKMSENIDLYQSRTMVSCDYSAVTAACMMVKKSVFDEIGGFDSRFKVAFNDVDLCLRVRQLDKLVVYIPQARLYHYESKSRGIEDTPEKQKRFLGEVELFAERWSEILEKGDPYYNVNLTLDSTDFSLRA